jgi:predicted amino acid dehydrogenase
MSRSFIVASVVATGAVGYAIACWLANMTGYAERIDRERDHRQLAARSERLEAQQC